MTVRYFRSAFTFATILFTYVLINQTGNNIYNEIMFLNYVDINFNMTLKIVYRVSNLDESECV